MRRNQIAGILLLGAGFVAAVIAGLFFALQMQSGGGIGDVLNQAIWIFLGILPVLMGGIYLYNQSANTPVADSDVTRQLRLLDQIPLHHEVRIETLCHVLRWTDAEVEQAMSGLIEMDLFTGYWNHAQGVIVRSDQETVASWRACRVCDDPITLTLSPVECAACATTYYVANS